MQKISKFSYWVVCSFLPGGSTDPVPPGYRQKRPEPVPKLARSGSTAPGRVLAITGRFLGAYLRGSSSSMAPNRFELVFPSLSSIVDLWKSLPSSLSLP